MDFLIKKKSEDEKKFIKELSVPKIFFSWILNLKYEVYEENV